jgi:hypothetical protein
MPTFVELSGATPPGGYETDGKSLVQYLKGGDAPRRDYFYWELHLNKPIQAARFGDWKAVRNGVDKPIEIYDLAGDAGELVDVAASHPELVARARAIFAEAHRPDPNWPLRGPSAAHDKSAKEAWAIKRARDKDQYIPDDAIPMNK